MSVRNQVHIELALDPETQVGLCSMICDVPYQQKLIFVLSHNYTEVSC